MQATATGRRFNAFIATHSVAMDLNNRHFSGRRPRPISSGKFVAFDVNDFNHELPAQEWPAGSQVLATQEFAHFEQAEHDLTEGKTSAQKGDAAQALALAEQAEALNPGYYQNATLRGKALMTLGKAREAAAAFTAALAGQPAFAKERRDLEASLQKCQALEAHP